MPEMVAGIRKTDHIALKVQYKGIPPGETSQNTTKSKIEVDKEQVWKSNKCRNSVFNKSKLFLNQKKTAPQQARHSDVWQGKGASEQLEKTDRLITIYKHICRGLTPPSNQAQPSRSLAARPSGMGKKNQKGKSEETCELRQIIKVWKGK